MQMTPNTNTGTLTIAWESTQFSIPFTVLKK
jgi:hypothetical protein